MRIGEGRLYHLGRFEQMLPKYDLRHGRLHPPVPILLQPTMAAFSHPLVLALQRPALEDVAWWYVRIVKLFAVSHMFKTLLVAAACVVFGVVVPDPAADFEEANVGRHFAVGLLGTLVYEKDFPVGKPYRMC